MPTSKKQTPAKKENFEKAMQKQYKSRPENQVMVPAMKRTKSYTTLPAKKKK
jgi:hypothetical protein